MLHEELSSHMMKEEQILFPMIKQGMGSGKAWGQSRDGKRAIDGRLLEVIKHTTNNVTPPTAGSLHHLGNDALLLMN